MNNPAVSKSCDYTVMVVDDDPDSLYLMVLVLEHAGYKVMSEPTMNDAIQELTHTSVKVDALVTDYNLGDGTGTELVSFLGSKCPNVRILVSGSSYLQTGRMFDAFLVKPVLPETLCEVLSALLKKEAA